MASRLLEQARTMAAFEIWANGRALASLGTVAAARRSEGAYARARSILAHNQMARQLWLSRLGAAASPAWVAFPDWPLERIEREAAELDAKWAAFIAGLSEADLAREVRYSGTDGSAYGSTVGDILTHVLNHSTYHRGQVASLAASLGGTPAETDFILFTRREYPSAG
ncbi:MAG: DinB family protein [Phycisphaerae bacterium]|nr:DinB family protein [Phycisphaerae bacterium]